MTESSHPWYPLTIILKVLAALSLLACGFLTIALPINNLDIASSMIGCFVGSMLLFGVAGCLKIGIHCELNTQALLLASQARASELPVAIDLAPADA